MRTEVRKIALTELVRIIERPRVDIHNFLQGSRVGILGSKGVVDRDDRTIQLFRPVSEVSLQEEKERINMLIGREERQLSTSCDFEEVATKPPP